MHLQQPALNFMAVGGTMRFVRNVINRQGERAIALNHIHERYCCNYNGLIEQTNHRGCSILVEYNKILFQETS